MGAEVRGEESREGRGEKNRREGGEEGRRGEGREGEDFLLNDMGNLGGF